MDLTKEKTASFLLFHNVMRSAAERATCLHCAEPLSSDQSAFCCRGCETVFRVLHFKGLEKFYELQTPTSESRSVGARFFDRQFDTRSIEGWDLPDFRQKYVHENELRCYLDGIHCLGCLWLVENIPTQVAGVTSARLDLGRQVATFRVTSDANLPALGKELFSYGYRPTPLDSMAVEESEIKKKQRKEILRLGVAAVAASNLMLSAIPLYSGVGKDLSPLFTSLSASLFLLVIGFAAVPFYQASGQALKRGTLSIDLPISFAIIFGGAYSYWNYLRGSETIYFDSLSTIVFLLLGVRMLLKRMQSVALLPQGNSWENAAVRVGDRITVEEGQMLPADGILRTAVAEIETSVLTGEPFPRKVLWGDTVYAGSRLCSGSASIEVMATGENSRLGKILSQVRTLSAMGSKWGRLADRVGKWFVIGVGFVILLSLFTRNGGDWNECIRRILAISVVSCPCAFAFAVPLAFVLSLRKLAKCGVFVCEPDSLERLASVKNLFLDKTGTLTEGQLEVVKWEWCSPDPLIPVAVRSLEEISRHPVARAIVRDLSGVSPIEVSSYQEIPGLGIEGVIQSRRFRLSSASEPSPEGLTRIAVEELESNATKWVATCELRDRLRPDSAEVVRRLLGLGLNLWVLSGDSELAVKKVAREVGINEGQALGRLTPGQKADTVAEYERTLMVGDGANDAIAFVQADVSVAVSGGVELSLQCSDIYLTRPGISSVASVIRFSRKLRHVIYANLLLSLVFNSVAIFFAFMGALSPLFAAVFMPISSVCVLMVSWLGIRRIAC